MPNSLLKIDKLCVDFKTPHKKESAFFRAVDNIGFTIEKGETLALVGESGSGKSVTALSIMQLLPRGIVQYSDDSSILFNGEELIDKDDSFMRTIRGRKIGMIFQEPQSSLNPLHTVEKQIAEALRLHHGMNKDQARARILELLDMVGLERLRARLHAYPHELSGGQRQRIMIAMALAGNPDLLIADEPTTALDVTVQAQILELLSDIKNQMNMALLLITHDLSIVKKMADMICVMKSGKVVEKNKAERLFSAPQQNYTKMLLAAQPKGTVKKAPNNAPVLMKGANIKVHFPKSKNFFGKTTAWVKAVEDVSVTVKAGHTVGVVGESGSGKTTLGLALLRLIKSEGEITFDGLRISAMNRKEIRPLREKFQVVFQDPFSSLSPRMSVGSIIGEGLKLHRTQLRREEREALIIRALEDVHMDPETRHRYPHEFSGGQRQRIAIARATVLQPKFVVLDEPTSALDVSVQAQIIDLLRELQNKHGLAYMFISHDLRVVRAMAHDLIVMKDGRVVESGPAEDIFTAPQEDYTKALLDAALNLKARE